MTLWVTRGWTQNGAFTLSRMYANEVNPDRSDYLILILIKMYSGLKVWGTETVDATFSGTNTVSHQGSNNFCATMTHIYPNSVVLFCSCDALEQIWTASQRLSLSFQKQRISLVYTQWFHVCLNKHWKKHWKLIRGKWREWRNDLKCKP